MLISLDYTLIQTLYYYLPVETCNNNLFWFLHDKLPKKLFCCYYYFVILSTVRRNFLSLSKNRSRYSSYALYLNCLKARELLKASTLPIDHWLNSGWRPLCELSQSTGLKALPQLQDFMFSERIKVFFNFQKFLLTTFCSAKRFWDAVIWFRWRQMSMCCGGIFFNTFNSWKENNRMLSFKNMYIGIMYWQKFDCLSNKNDMILWL